MSAGDTANALTLIKRQWGYMLDTHISTGSTFWEGYQASGEFAFQGIYMSHAHGWSTGPASALTFYALGLRPHTPGWQEYTLGGQYHTLGGQDYNQGGQEYVVAPQPIGLQWCNGSLSFGSGSVQVAWLLERESDRSGGDGAQSSFSVFHLVVDTSMHTEATAGHIGLPLSALNISRPEEANISFNEETVTHAHTQGVLGLPHPDTQGVLGMGNGVEPSAWGLRDGRLWFVVLRPGRFSVHLRPVMR